MLEAFPPTENALSDPNGLLAVGGDLTPHRLLHAYSQGIFPWYEPGEPILWWTPNPRAVLFPARFHRSRSFSKFLRNVSWTVGFDTSFETVIESCAEFTPDRPETWISDEMKAAYLDLHQLGFAHSIEAYIDGVLAGGLYGVVLGRVFFGESMFSRLPNGSKLALHALCELGAQGGLDLIDCQLPNDHLSSLGMELIQREEFESILKTSITPIDINDDTWLHSMTEATSLSLDNKLLKSSLAPGK